MTQPQDLHTWTQNAITNAEQNATRWHDIECETHGMSLTDALILHSATLCDCRGPEAVLRRCAADRKLLALHAPTTGHNVYGGTLPACSACGTPEEYPVRFPCPTVRALAEGYGWTEDTQ